MNRPNEHRKSSLWRDAWLRLAKNKLAVTGALLLGALAFASVCGPMLLSQSYYEQNLQLGAKPPSAQQGRISHLYRIVRDSNAGSDG